MSPFKDKCLELCLYNYAHATKEKLINLLSLQLNLQLNFKFHLEMSRELRRPLVGTDYSQVQEINFSTFQYEKVVEPTRS